MLGKAIANEMQSDVTIFNLSRELKHHLELSRVSVLLSAKSLLEQEDWV